MRRDGFASGQLEPRGFRRLMRPGDHHDAHRRRSARLRHFGRLGRLRGYDQARGGAAGHARRHHAGAPREGRKRRRRSKRREYGAFACFRGCARGRLRFAFRGRLGGGRAQQRGRALLARPYEGL